MLGFELPISANRASATASIEILVVLEGNKESSFLVSEGHWWPLSKEW